ncbi:MAG TPA: B-box zinc finger protein [Anaerolineae bacterium]
MNLPTNQVTDQETRSPEEFVLHCAYHPNRETVLRCNRCGQPICNQCAVLTEVGYRCKQCVRNQRQVYFNARSYDLPVAAVVGFVLGALVSIVAGLLLGRLMAGFLGFLIAFFAGPAVGGVIAEAIRWSVGRRRALHLNAVAVTATVLGMLLIGLVAVPLGGLGALMGMLPMLLFVVLAASTIYARLQ